MKDFIYFIMSMCIFLLIGYYFTSKKKKSILENFEYSTAVVIKKYEYGYFDSVKGSLPSVNVFYGFEDQYFESDIVAIGMKLETIFDKSKIEPVEVGDRFLMIVSKNDPNKFIILWDFKLIQQGDFEKYVKKFEELQKLSNADANCVNN